MPSKGVIEALDSLKEIKDYYFDQNQNYIAHSSVVSGTSTIVSKSTRLGSVINRMKNMLWKLSLVDLRLMALYDKEKF